MKDSKPQRNQAPAAAGAAHRARYTKPQLVVYGPLAKLTRGTQSGTGENTAQGGMKSNMCL